MFAAGRSTRVVGVGRVVEIQLDSRCGQLRSVEVGRSISPVMTVCCG